MESSQPKKRFFQNALRFALMGLFIGAAGYFVGDKLADWLPPDQLRQRLGLAADFHVSLGELIAIVFALLYAALHIVSIILFLNLYFNPEKAQKSAVFQVLGSGKNGRKSILPLCQFYAANMAIIILLMVAEVWLIKGVMSWLFLGVAILMGLLMVTSSVQLWHSLDELLKVIWIESMAITSGIFLVAAMSIAMAIQVGLDLDITRFQAIIGFHILYLVVYLAIAAKRAPDSFGTLEDETT
jgi:hypothetical protein